MRTKSSIPFVLPELVARFSRILPDVKVTDGRPKPPEDSEPDILCIGFTGEPGEPAVENTRTNEQLARDPDRESYDVTCIASSWRGNNTDAELVRNHVFGILNVISEELAKDHTLGGLVMLIRMHTDALAQEQTKMGAVATARFVLHVDAFTRG